MSHGSQEFTIALVGGGPRATYALERLAATVDRVGGRRLAIHVYESSGEFGAGQLHSTEQPHTSYGNQAASRIAFAADATVAGATPIRPFEERPTLHEWCRQRFQETGDPAFDLAPGDFPRRRQHGLALREMFERHVAELSKAPGVTVTLHAEEVTDLPATDDGRLDVVTTSGVYCTADRVLLVTGHSSNDCAGEPAAEGYRAFAQRTGAGYVPSAYPLERHLSPEALPAGTTVGCAGLGLTAIDQILYLTEGRGGRFESEGGRLRYQASGSEPATVYAFSWTGFLPHTRALNRKEHPYQGRFLTVEAIDRLRAAAGLPTQDGGRPQLDFESQVMPLIVLEMAAAHYGTLFGPTVVDLIAAAIDDDYRKFLDGAAGAGQVTRLLPGVERIAAQIGGKLREVLTGRLSLTEAAAAVPGWDPAETLTRWLTVVFGADQADSTVLAHDERTKVVLPSASPWRLSTEPSANRFDWASLMHPVRLRPGSTPAEFKAAYLDFLDRDLLWANQGDADNPYKASIDNVWRDLRPVIGHAVDGGGLTADSHRQFLDRFRRLQNKLSEGTAPEVMAKIRALIEHGVLDVSAGPRAVVLFDEDNARFMLHGDETAMRAPLDVLLDSRVHQFDATRDLRPLYRNLVERGLVRLWQHRTPGQQTFTPGFIDLDEQSRPIGLDGRAAEAVTVLGPPAAARHTYRFAALRPHRNDEPMREIVAWLDEVWTAFDNAKQG